MLAATPVAMDSCTPKDGVDNVKPVDQNVLKPGQVLDTPENQAAFMATVKSQPLLAKS
jgi:hypothetical protein